MQPTKGSPESGYALHQPQLAPDPQRGRRRPPSWEATSGCLGGPQNLPHFAQPRSTLPTGRPQCSCDPSRREQPRRGVAWPQGWRFLPRVQARPESPLARPKIVRMRSRSTASPCGISTGACERAVAVGGGRGRAQNVTGGRALGRVPGGAGGCGARARHIAANPRLLRRCTRVRTHMDRTTARRHGLGR